MVRFVPGIYPLRPGLLIKLPLNVVFTLLVLNTLNVLIVRLPLSVSGLVKSLTVAESAAPAPVIIRLFSGIFASRK